MNEFLPMGISALKQHVMPYHRSRTTRLYEICQRCDMATHAFAILSSATLKTGWRLCLVAAKMKIWRITKVLVHLGNKFTQYTLCFWI